MKNLFKIAMFAAGSFVITSGYAQTSHESTGHKINKTAKKVGHKTSEVAAKGAAAVVDKKYDSKMGPNGETIYINKNSHYYYVNKLGHRVYLKKEHLRDRPVHH